LKRRRKKKWLYPACVAEAFCSPSGGSTTARRTPVTAVYGNTDMNLPFKETEVIELAARKFLIHHIVNPFALTDKLKDRIAWAQPHVVVFGHTHRTFCETVGGVLYFNPGSAGKPKFGLGRTVAILHCDAKEIRHEFIPL
jgi:hypothetical protein